MDVQAMHCQGPEQCSRSLLKSRAGSNTVAGGDNRRVPPTVHLREHPDYGAHATIRAVHTADELIDANRHLRERQVTTTARLVVITPGGRFSKDYGGLHELAYALAEGNQRVLPRDRPNCGRSDVQVYGRSESHRVVRAIRSSSR